MTFPESWVSRECQIPDLEAELKPSPSISSDPPPSVEGGVAHPGTWGPTLQLRSTLAPKDGSLWGKSIMNTFRKCMT